MNNNESYLGNPNVKRDGVNEKWTPKKLSEYKKCMGDPAYFCKKYVKVIHLDKGLVPFKLYPYQEKMFQHFEDNRFSIVLACHGIIYFQVFDLYALIRLAIRCCSLRIHGRHAGDECFSIAFLG